MGDKTRRTRASSRTTRRDFLRTAAVTAAGWTVAQTGQAAERRFQAGAAAIDISPLKFPAIVSGGFLQKKADTVIDRLHARCLVLDDGTTRLAIVVVDNLMMPRELIDDAKRRVEQATGIGADRILVSATHTHTAPSVMGALGTGVDPDYAPRLPGWIAESVAAAVKNLAPAKVGWAVGTAPEHTHCRRWIYRPDRMLVDPFGARTVRANMHPGYQNPDCIGPAGPADPGLSLLAVQSIAGRPLAVLANYSMHYVGAPPVSADYYGPFCGSLARLVGSQHTDSPVVAMISQGTSGDLHWMDYGQPLKKTSYTAYAEQMARLAFDAYRRIEYRTWVPLAMAQEKLTLRRRVPDDKRLAWARSMVAGMRDPTAPANRPEVYAKEQVYLNDEPQRELVLQAIRVGDLGIAAIPNEVYGLTGLKIKAQSPLEPTFNMELANGSEGYIPPPEQHKLGGYTTWPARTAGLEVQAEPKIVEALLQLLEKVAGRPRRKAVETCGRYATAVLASRPMAYWRLGEMAGREAHDASQHGCQAMYEDGVVFYLEGPAGSGFCSPGQTSRAAHFAGGRVIRSLSDLPPAYTFEAWFWSGLVVTARPVTGYLFSREPEGAGTVAGDVLGIGGKESATGRLFFSGGSSPVVLAGSTEIRLRTWNHVVLVRDGAKAVVYLNGNARPEIAAETVSGCPCSAQQIFVGGRSDGAARFEGKIAEVALYGRALGPDEIVRHYAAAGIKS
jgi:hypothetical protein